MGGRGIGRCPRRQVVRTDHRWPRAPRRTQLLVQGETSETLKLSIAPTINRFSGVRTEHWVFARHHLEDGASEEELYDLRPTPGSFRTSWQCGLCGGRGCAALGAGDLVRLCRRTMLGDRAEPETPVPRPPRRAAEGTMAVQRGRRVLMKVQSTCAGLNRPRADGSTRRPQGLQMPAHGVTIPASPTIDCTSGFDLDQGRK